MADTRNLYVRGLLEDTVKATPRNSGLGLLSDLVAGVNAYAQREDKTMPMGKANPPLSLLSNVLGFGDLAAMLDRASYGQPITNAGKANVPLIPQQTGNALMALSGLAAPVAKYGPQAAQAAIRNAQIPSNVARQGEKGAIVWHGSPHKFDAFDSSKIGTGEGAQAYGHGLYLAESPDVARSYQRDLSTKVTADGKQILANNRRVGSTGNSEVDDYLIANNGDLNAALRQAILDRRSIPVSNGNRSELDPVIAHLKNLGGKVETVMDGSLYKVDLPDEHIAKMLDWDKPLSQQAAAVAPMIEKLRSLPVLNRDNFGAPGHLFKSERDLLDSGQIKGADLYNIYRREFGGASMSGAGGSNELRSLGIPGIRYLDGGSRGTGTGTSNFVVFPGNEGLLQILERNGQPLK